MINNKLLRKKIAEMPRLKSTTSYKILLTLINDIMDGQGQVITTKTALANKVGVRIQHVNRNLNPLIENNLIAVEGDRTFKLKYSLGSYFDAN